MTIRGLTLYISGALGVAWLMSLSITYAPGAENFASTMHAITFLGAITAAVFARYLRDLPPDHWAHQSRPLWWTTASMAILVTLFAMTMVG
jgi:hypothetical protein